MELRKASKGQVKYLQSLKLKKNRLKYASFVAEGSKVIKDIICDNILDVKEIYAVDSFYTEEKEWLSTRSFACYLISQKELDQISTLRTPHHIVAECSIPQQVLNPHAHSALFLDQIADPGNLGTLLRSCDWFGIEQLVLSPGCADLFNPKAVQAAKGSTGRIPFTIMDVAELSSKLPQHHWYYADMGGTPVQQLEVSKPFILAVGSESHGLSKETLSMNGYAVSLPKVGQSRIDSLNVATATTALLAFFCR